MECYSAMKKMPCHVDNMDNPEHIVLHGVGQAEKDKCSTISLVQGL